MKRTDICPWWAGGALRIPVRKLIHNQEKLLSPYIQKGMTAVDVGCGMGYLTIDMARLAGESGKVIAVDLQEKMLAGIRRIRYFPEVEERVILHQCKPQSLAAQQWNGQVDFAALFMMLHEVPDQQRLLYELKELLKPGGCCLFAEPVFHVSKKSFMSSLSNFKEIGFTVVSYPHIAICRAALLIRTSDR